MASVIGLTDHDNVYGARVARLPLFLSAWTRAWPGLHMQFQESFLNHPEMRGFGCAAGHYMALMESMRYLRQYNETCDYHLMFEDDAFSFNGTTWPPSAAANDLESRLAKMEQKNWNVMLLGGTTFTNLQKDAAAAAAAEPQGGIVYVEHADGSFAYALKCSAMASVAKGMLVQLRQTTKSFGFEKALWDSCAPSRTPNTTVGVYVSAPLLVDHAHGMSATHYNEMNYPFEGNAKFW